MGNQLKETIMVSMKQHLYFKKNTYFGRLCRVLESISTFPDIVNPLSAVIDQDRISPSYIY